MCVTTTKEQYIWKWHKQHLSSKWCSFSLSYIVPYGATSLSISHLISLLQPPFGFDFKWKTITQIALLFLTLGEIRGAFQWWLIIKWHVMQRLDWCRNLQLLKWKPHVDISRATKHFPTLGEHNATLKILVCVMHGDWTSCLAGKCLKHWQEACIVYMAHAIHLYSWGFARRKS